MVSGSGDNERMTVLGPGSAQFAWRTPAAVVLAACLIAMVGFGVRSSFGLFLAPMTLDRGWDRETFAFAMAVQNLLWGLGVPFASALADKYGPARVLAGGAVLYALGTAGMVVAGTAMALHLLGGILTGLGLAFTAFSIALATMARVVGPHRRSFALGLGTAAGSVGQVVFPPLGQAFIAAYGWDTALVILAATVVVIAPLAYVLSGNADKGAAATPHADQTIAEALRVAARPFSRAGAFAAGGRLEDAGDVPAPPFPFSRSLMKTTLSLAVPAAASYVSLTALTPAYVDILPSTLASAAARACLSAG